MIELWRAVQVGLTAAALAACGGAGGLSSGGGPGPGGDGGSGRELAAPDQPVSPRDGGSREARPPDRPAASDRGVPGDSEGGGERPLSPDTGPGPCTDLCSRGATACDGGGVVLCADRDGDGCTEWGPPSPCEAGCEAGRCKEPDAGLVGGACTTAADCARQTRDTLAAQGFEVQYEELPGAGHCCYPYDKNDAIWEFLATHPLP